TYKNLCEFIPILGCNSSSPIKAVDLNPLIQQLLTTHSGSTIFGVGGHSVLLSITEDIAAKVSLKPSGKHVRHEQSIFKLLDQVPCPYIIHSFLCAPNITYMPLFKNGTLYERMSMDDKPRPVLQWMLQLSEAVACLESLGYAHGELNPRNILLDNQDQLRLVDFDHALKIGDDLDVGYEPYVRASKAAQQISGGTYGKAGPITEQFALGLIFWYMSRGTELYAELDGPDKVDRLIEGELPVVNLENPIDGIIFDSSPVTSTDRMIQQPRKRNVRFRR
ncbi:serine/threonine protein kinase, partial [Polytolypa hystricis UAMH7299]